MNFNSALFLLFLPAVLSVHLLLLRRPRAGRCWLLLASYVFYMSWDWRYAGLLAASTIVDYFAGLGMARARRTAPRRSLLIVSLAFNLGMLAVFKYFNFFMDSIADGASLLGIDATTVHLRFLLPVGISFYTFQTLSYTIDLYRRRIEPERDPVRFALFVSFFPQLVAGPIVRASDFLPQLHQAPATDQGNMHRGLVLVFRGLIKKVLIADLLAGLAVDAVFADSAAFSSLDHLLALYAYAFQIYNDFSGYTDIAIGVALMLGYTLPVNFDRPYLAQSVREFWQRWHISLSTWLRDYLYIPLGGSRGGPRRTAINLMITMLLGGLWHGAAMNFVLWGGYHGLLLMIFRRTHETSGQSLALIWLRRLGCFHLVLFGWLLFRVQSLAQLGDYLRGLGSGTIHTDLKPMFFAVLALAALTHFLPRSGYARLIDRFTAAPAPVQAAVYTTLLLIIVGLSLETPAFIYFQF